MVQAFQSQPNLTPTSTKPEQTDGLKLVWKLVKSSKNFPNESKTDLFRSLLGSAIMRHNETTARVLIETSLKPAPKREKIKFASVQIKIFNLHRSESDKDGGSAGLQRLNQEDGPNSPAESGTRFDQEST